jgi:hypothetical protein
LGADAPNASLVEIPTLSAFLLGYEQKGVLMLRPLYDVPGTSLTAGTAYTASAIFGVLHPLALAIKGGNQ